MLLLLPLWLLLPELALLAPAQKFSALTVRQPGWLGNLRAASFLFPLVAAPGQQNPPAVFRPALATGFPTHSLNPFAQAGSCGFAGLGAQSVCPASSTRPSLTLWLKASLEAVGLFLKQK